LRNQARQAAGIGLSTAIALRLERRTDHHNLDTALAVVFFPGVGDVVHIGGAGFKPADVLRAAMARHHAKARRQFRVKR
jgi:hypothetical protein